MPGKSVSIQILIGRNRPGVGGERLTCNCLVLLAQNLSLGLLRFHMFRSPTCAPSGVLIRMMLPAGAAHARPERIGSVNSATRVRGARAMVV